jgi:Zn-dependent metalloprotease
MRHRSLTAISASVLLTASTFAIASSSSAQPQDTAGSSTTASGHSGSFALSGADARSYELPADVRQVWTASRPDGTTQTRYQQVVDEATVFGGQITVLTAADGTTRSVVGAYFPGLEPANSKRLSKRDARAEVEHREGTHGRWSTELRIDARDAKLFYQVESIRGDSRPVRWINAGNGNVVKAFDALAHGRGTGIKGDTKTIDTTKNARGQYRLVTSDDRQETYDLQNKAPGADTLGVLMTDADDVWDFNRGVTSPSQAAGVDAHYYAGVVDSFYGDVFNRNSIDDNGMKIVSRVHYDRNYCNAFWNGSSMTYGDGDNRGCLPLAGGLDVIGHELTHGVTEHTSGLIYENESGALNEAFSDMMGNTIEYYADAQGLDPSVGPDFRIGEDVIDPGTAGAGFRNMADPGEFGDPDHMIDLYTGTSDNGGVHTNSGIANHAYYLTVQGGRNAGCTATALRAATHTEDCGVTVAGIGLDRAEHVFYDGFSSLPEYANFCDARNATVAVAGDAAGSVDQAWDAVGVHDGCTPGQAPPPPCTGNPDVQAPFASPHPYGNNGNCTWTHNHGSAGFSFHFTQMDTEKNYDFVYVKDANGTVLATYTGTYRRAFSSPCITTTSGSVQLVSDPAVTGQGFAVDRIDPC